MVTLKYTALLVLLMVLLGCNHSNKKSIKDWELQHNSCELMSFQTLSSPKPFFAKDSLEILKVALDYLYQQKLNNLSIQIDSAKTALIEAQQEHKKINNPLLKEAYKLGVNRLEYKYNQLLLVDSTYRNHIELTEFQNLRAQQQVYKKHPQDVLGYTVYTEFLGKEGALEKKYYRKTYFLSSDKYTIQAEL